LDHAEVVAWHNDPYNDGTALISSYAGLYWPWVQINDSYWEERLYIPPSAFAVEALAYTDQVTYPWFAPAGFQRGKVSNVLRAETTITQGDIDAMYGQGNAVNPLRTFSGSGIVIWGQRTLQRVPTALDRINVRRLLLTLRRAIASSVNVLVFEPNDPVLWRQFRALVTPILVNAQINRGIREFRVVCDETTNTPDVIEQNTMVGKIFIKPTKAAEIIQVDFIITSQGTNFEETLVTA
jgi:uncharacterized protein